MSISIMIRSQAGWSLDWFWCLNKTPIDWFSKNSLVLSLPLMDLSLLLQGLAQTRLLQMRYMLRMIGVYVEGPSMMFGDNLSVTNSASIPEDTLNKRHTALSYHRVREAIATKVLKFHHISSKEYPADLLTKFLPSSIWWPLMKPNLHWPKKDKDNP